MRRQQPYENNSKIDERRPATPNHRPSSARNRTNPNSSQLPPSPHADEVFMIFFCFIELKLIHVTYFLFREIHLLLQQYQTYQKSR